MDKRWGILIGIITLATVIGCVFLCVITDNEAPQISFASNVPDYTGNPNDKQLLSNVTAMDKKDGDVSNTLYVDCVRVSEDGTRAKVTYVAMDRSNNVSRVSQILSCKKAEKKSTDSNAKKQTIQNETTEDKTQTEDIGNIDSTEEQ